MNNAWHLPGLLDEIPEGDGTARAAVLIPLYEAAGEVRTILTKRPMHMPTHAGDLAFPGGKPHPEDRDPVDTALREASEEIGIARDSVDIIGYLAPIHTVSYAHMVVPVVGRLDGEPHLEIDENEVAKVLCPPLEPFLDESNWRFETWQGHRVFFFDLPGEVLWGATASMVRRLVGLADDHP